LNIRNVLDARRFTAEKAFRESMVDSAHMKCDIHCLAPGQNQKPHIHEDSDKIYFVVEGCGTFLIGDEEFEVGERNIIHAPAGMTHSVSNDTSSNLVLLVFMAPLPAHA
jgi:mannose-6-phosphate isomerase-like protein (cupin superfamily)